MYRSCDFGGADATAVRRLGTRVFTELDIVSALARTGDPTFRDHHVDREALTFRKSGHCNSTFQAVVQRIGGNCSIGSALILQLPLVKRITQWFGFGLPNAVPLIGVEMFDFSLVLLRLPDGGQYLLVNLALVAICNFIPQTRDANMRLM